MSEKRPSQRVTIVDVAYHAGVSISTVSRVINQTAPVSKETTQSVLQAIEELNYIPHMAARQLVSRKTNMLGVVLGEIGRDFYLPMLRGIEEGARMAGYNLLIATTQGQAETGWIGEYSTDGLLVFTDSLKENELRRLCASGFRIVSLLCTPPEKLNIPYVAFENKRGARQMVDHLVENCGYTRIAFLRGPETNEDSQWREIGYRESLEAHGIPFDPALVAEGGFEEQISQIAVEQWLADGVEMEAIFAADDDSAIGAMIALKRAGLRIPQDVAVVGFDDLPMVRYLTPALTTVRAPIEKAGYEAVRQLVALIEHDGAEPVTLLPTELIIRDSCGCNSPVT